VYPAVKKNSFSKNPNTFCFDSLEELKLKIKKTGKN